MTRRARKAPSAVSQSSPARKFRSLFTALRLGVGLAACLFPALVFAQNDDWTGGTGNWTTASMWNGGVPTTTSNVFIDNGNSAASAVTVDTNPAQCNNLTIDGDDSLTVGNGQALYVGGSSVSNAGTLGITAFSGYLFFTGPKPIISNAGTISLNAVSGGTVGLNVSGAATLKGTGNVSMTNASGNYIMGPYQPSPGASLTNLIAIRGAGGIGGGGGIGAGNTFTNRASINANQTTPLIITNNTGETFINTGTLEATNKGTLELAGGTITNTGGTIHAATGSAVVLQGGPTSGVTITGGTLTTGGTGTIQDNCCFNTSTLNGVTISTGSAFQLNTNHGELWQGTITNNGSFTMNDQAGFGTDLNMSGGVTLKGTGTLTMGNDSANRIMGYGQPSPGASLTNQITIQGSGQIGLNTGGIGSGNTFTNQASIIANQATPLVITGSTGQTFNNTGMLEATNGATLELAGGAITNTGGIIHAATGSAVVLQGGPTSGVTITGGTLSTSGTGTIQDNCCFNTSTLDNVTINGTFQLNTNHNELWAGTITNNGTFQINDQNFTTALDMNGAVTLKGPGTLVMSNDTGNEIMGYGQPGTGSLLNESTIEGAGSFGFNGGIGAGNGVTNAGTIYADQSKPLTIEVSSGTFTNSGTLKVKQGSAMYITGGGFTNFTGGNTLTGGKYMVSGTLGFDNAKIGVNSANITLTGGAAQIINDVNGTKALAHLFRNTSAGSISLQSGKILYMGGKLTNLGKIMVGAGSGLQLGALPLGGYIQSAGSTTVDGALAAPNGMNIQGGTLSGAGAIATTLQSSGSVTAGDSAASPGKLSINGSFTQNSAGALNIAIGGLTAGTQYGQIAVTNGVSLNGTLNLTLINGFLPKIGDNFVIMTGSAISGTFATVNGLSINSGEHFVIAYNPANVTLTVVTGP
jgi:fibronectin-binding autotransporter adhesin